MSAHRRLDAAGTHLRATVIVAVWIGAAVSGCGGGDDDGAGSGGSSGGAPPAALEYPAELSSASSPSDVARVLIRALDAGDNRTMTGLVAAKAEAEAVDAIFRKHGRRANTRPEAAAALAVSGWRATYAVFRKGETEVDREAVEADTATVFARGRLRSGEARRLKITLLREDGCWKVRAGLQTLVAEP